MASTGTFYRTKGTLSLKFLTQALDSKSVLRLTKFMSRGILGHGLPSSDEFEQKFSKEIRNIQVR